MRCADRLLGSGGWDSGRSEAVEAGQRMLEPGYRRLRQDVPPEHPFTLDITARRQVTLLA